MYEAPNFELCHSYIPFHCRLILEHLHCNEQGEPTASSQMNQLSFRITSSGSGLSENYRSFQTHLDLESIKKNQKIST